MLDGRGLSTGPTVTLGGESRGEAVPGSSDEFHQARLLVAPLDKKRENEGKEVGKTRAGGKSAAKLENTRPGGRGQLGVAS